MGGQIRTDGLADHGRKNEKKQRKVSRAQRNGQAPESKEGRKRSGKQVKSKNRIEKQEERFAELYTAEDGDKTLFVVFKVLGNVFHLGPLQF